MTDSTLAIFNDIPADDTSKRIGNRKAHNIAKTAQKLRVSRRLLISKRAEYQTCVCDVTGIVSSINIPLIPVAPTKSAAHRMVLIYKHPLANVANARGLASLGLDYLRQLDTQVLAGILIVLADEYNMFAYQPSDSGAQKNAILRTIGKDVLIDAVLLIESIIHSANHRFLPRMSLLADSDLQDGAMAARCSEWLKLVADAVYSSAQREDEDDYYASAPDKHFKPSSMRVIKKVSTSESKEAKAKAWAATNARWAAQREFKADKLSAKKLIAAMVSSNVISLKLAALIKAVITDDTLLTMDEAMRAMIVMKLDDLHNDDASGLSALIRKDRSILKAVEFDITALDSLDEAESDNVDASALDELDSSELAQSEVDSEECTQTEDNSDEDYEGEEEYEVADSELLIDVDGVGFVVQKAVWDSLGIMAKLAHKRRLRAEFPESFNK